MQTVFIATIALALVGSAAPLVAQGRPVLAIVLTATLDTFRAQYDFPVVTAAIALPDGTLVTAAAGLADIEGNRAMSPETRSCARCLQQIRSCWPAFPPKNGNGQI